VTAAAGIVAGAVGGIALTRIASAVFGVVRMPGMLTTAGAATPRVSAAILASLVPAARASRVDVLQALRSEETTPAGSSCFVRQLCPPQPADQARPRSAMPRRKRTARE
jgi:hypothetical protein